MKALIGSRHAVSALLGILLAGALVVIAMETDGGRKWRAAVPAGDRAIGARGEDALLPPFVLPAPDTGFRETVERPLWVPTRRPAPAGNSSQAMRKGQFRLTGTSVNAALSMAYLVDTATGKTHSVVQGREINGVTVETVEATRVVLRQGEDSEELRLSTAPSPKVPVVAAAPAPPGQPGQAPGAPPGQFLPPGQNPGIVAGAVPPQPGAGFTPPGVVRPPEANAAAAAQAAAAAAAAAQAAAPDQPAARRRRFQNLPQ